jgi:hypothetical protein
MTVESSLRLFREIKENCLKSNLDRGTFRVEVPATVKVMLINDRSSIESLRT